MPKLRRQRLFHRRHDTNIMPLRLRWANGVAGSRRNPGREDKFTWNSGFFISPADIDGYPDDIVSDCEDEILQQILQDVCSRDERERRPTSLSLLDIAVTRPAKAKGVAKDFEIVQTPRRVFALEDDEGELLGADEDDWEDIYAEETQHMERRSYSDVLRGNDEQ